MSEIKIIDGILSSTLCRQLIDKFNNDTFLKSDPQPDYSTRRFLLVSEQLQWQKEVIKLTPIISEVVTDFFNYPGKFSAHSREDWVDDGLVMAHYRPGDTCAFHDDGQVYGCNVRLATVLFYLNDVDQGGETYFPLQDLKICPKEGRAVVFPPHLRFPHEVLEASSDRYILQTWICDPALIVLAEHEDM